MVIDNGWLTWYNTHDNQEGCTLRLIPIPIARLVATVAFLIDVIRIGLTTYSPRQRLCFLVHLWQSRKWAVRIARQPARFVYQRTWPLTRDPGLPETIAAYITSCCSRAPRPYGISNMSLGFFVDRTPQLQTEFSVHDAGQVVSRVEALTREAQIVTRGHHLSVVIVPLAAVHFDVPVRPVLPTATG